MGLAQPLQTFGDELAREYHVSTSGVPQFDARAVQLQLEWTFDMSIADMAQMVPQCNIFRIIMQPCNNATTMQPWTRSRT